MKISILSKEKSDTAVNIVCAASALVAWHAKKDRKCRIIVPPRVAIVPHVFLFATVATLFSPVVMMVLLVILVS